MLSLRTAAEQPELPDQPDGEASPKKNTPKRPHGPPSFCKNMWAECASRVASDRSLASASVYIAPWSPKNHPCFQSKKLFKTAGRSSIYIVLFVWYRLM